MPENGGLENGTVMEVPKYLFRYFSLPPKEKYHRIEDIFTQRKLFFPSPAKFNDPFDCRADNVNFSLPNDDQMRKFLHGMIKRQQSQMSRSERRHWVHSKMKAGAHRMIDYESVKADLQRRIYQHGVLSLSEVPNSLLMWSHYADSHKGLCLGFLHDNDFFGKALDVKYSSKAPVIDAFVDADEFEIEKILTTKAKCWEYEMEWRIIEIACANQHFTFPDGALVGVFFGYKFDREERDRLVKVIASVPNPPALYQVVLNPARYEILAEPLRVTRGDQEIIPFMPYRFSSEQSQPLK